jgi:DNA polymerase
MIAWLAGETEVLKLFRNEEDVYSHMASQIYGVPLEHITKPLRFVGKTAVLGLAYGMGWRKFHATLTLGLMGPKMALEPEEAQNIVNGFRRARAKTVAYWRTCDDILQHMLHDMDGEFGILQLNGAEKKLYLPNGMYLEYPGLCQSNDGFVYFDYENADIMARGGHPNPKRGKKIYGGKCCENISQALARIVIGEQLLTIAKRYKIATTTHDEIVAIAPEDEADEALEFMLATMRTPPVWAPDLPLNADGGFAREYSK